MKIPISVTILTKNSQKYLEEVLSALQLFDEVLSEGRDFAAGTEFDDDVCVVWKEFVGPPGPK